MNTRKKKAIERKLDYRRELQDLREQLKHCEPIDRAVIVAEIEDLQNKMDENTIALLKPF